MCILLKKSMGLSIHYSGSLAREEFLNNLVEEVADICKTLEWTTCLFDGDNADRLKGISFAAPGSELVFLSFLPGGRMCSPLNLITSEMYDGVQFEKELMFTASTKTHYAGPDAHIAIIKLLKYISGKYMKDFQLTDEGNYWESGDEKILYDQFKKYNFYLNAVSDSLSDLRGIPGESPANLADRIEKILKKKFKGDAE